jgi:GntR family transcriptional regulator
VTCAILLTGLDRTSTVLDCREDLVSQRPTGDRSGAVRAGAARAAARPGDRLGRLGRLVDGPVPKHVQLREILEAAARDELPAHAPVGSERALMSRYGVSRATVREAVGQLVSDGVLYRVHGKGTFVAPARVESQLHLASFTQDMRRRGLAPTTRVLHATRTSPPRRAAIELGLGPGEQAWCLERLRIAGGEPMALELGWYPERLLPGLDRHDLSTSLYTLLAQTYDVVIDAAQQSVWAESADAHRADLLGVPVGAPLLAFRRTSSAGRSAVEHNLSWYRGDRYQVHMTLDRGLPPGRHPIQGGRGA